MRLKNYLQNDSKRLKMNSAIKPNPNKLHIYHEGKKRRVFAGELIYIKEKDIYELTYDEKYASSKSAIPVGPGLDLLHLRHESKKGKLFPSFLDRIPDKDNPAYEDYCRSQGISPEEKNYIILLQTIGRRGPSSFIYEGVYEDEFHPVDIINLRNKLQITQHDLATAFDIKQQTLQRIEAGTSYDSNTLKHLQIIFKFPEVALWQLKLTGSRVHSDVLQKLIQFFKS